jgi:drug/metabolite transporter (DMT)-like permease
MMLSPSRAYAALAAAGSLWGTGFLLGKIALVQLTPSHLILYRLLLACVGFVPVLLIQRPRIRREDWPTVWLAGIFGIPLVYLIQFEGLARTTVAHASLMVAMMPILLGIAGAAVAHERLTITHWVLLAVSAVGALLIAAGATSVDGSITGPTLLGDALVVGSLVAGVGWVLASKRLMRRYDPSSVGAVVTVAGTVSLAAWVLAVDGRPPTYLAPRVWAALAASGLLATTTANLLWNWGVSRVPVSEAGVFVNLEPVVGTLLGVTLLGDRLGWTGVAGGLLIIGAALAVTRGGATKSTEVEKRGMS